MDGIIIRLSKRRKRKFRQRARKAKNGDLSRRYWIVLNLAEGCSLSETARRLGASRHTIRAVARRFCEQGEAGLVDRREDNGQRKVDEDFLGPLAELVGSRASDHGWRRPTWTQEMLRETMEKKTGVGVSVGTISRALKRLGARWGQPKPTVACPWPKSRKDRRLRAIRGLAGHPPEGELVFYEDEVDIHLNPKIGRDWMLPGQQKEVLSPGQNQKRYLAGAENAQTGEMIWVEGERKNSLLFLLLLWELLQRHPDVKVIHVILDNYSIHHTQQVELSLSTPHGQRIKLHFLPPYCPDHNKIERTWRDLHANVTRNHHCDTIDELMAEVDKYLRDRNKKKDSLVVLAA
jgi:transposase